jgi:hypothetical protein
MVKLAAITTLGLIGLVGQAAAVTVKIMPFGASIVGAPVRFFCFSIIAQHHPYILWLYAWTLHVQCLYSPHLTPRHSFLTSALHTLPV